MQPALKARENARVQQAIGCGFAPHWLRRWREFCQPITEQSKAKPKQTIINFDNQLKTAVLVIWALAFVSLRNERVSVTCSFALQHNDGKLF